MLLKWIVHWKGYIFNVFVLFFRFADNNFGETIVDNNLDDDVQGNVDEASNDDE